MKFRLQLTVDVDLPDDMMRETYGTTEPFAVAQSIAAESRRRLDEYSRPELMVGSAITVHPLYG